MAEFNLVLNIHSFLLSYIHPFFSQEAGNIDKKCWVIF